MASFVHAVTQVLISPRRFFTPENLDNARAPRLVYATALAGAQIGSCVGEALELGAFDFYRMSLAVVVRFLTAFPILYLVAGWHHLVARALLPGRIGFNRSLTVVAYAGVPLVFSWNTWMAVAAGVWSLVLVALGFAGLRGIAMSRGASSPVAAVVLLVTVVFGIRTLVIEAFRISSLGMYPTLLIEDHVFAGKADFVFGRTLPAYGDIIVFEGPASDSSNAPADFIERVIALPGDTVEVRNNDLVINGKNVPRCFVGVHEWGNIKHNLSVERLGERAVLVAYAQDRPPENWGPFTVPPNGVFVVGDNRRDAYDSRGWNNGSGGSVDISRIQGRATSIWYPIARMAKLDTTLPHLPPKAAHLGDALRRCLAEVPWPTVPQSN